MIKINLILHQETLRRSKSEGKSSSSVSSFSVLNANDLLKSLEASGQIKPILKQSRKNNVFSKKYFLSYLKKKNIQIIHDFKYFRPNEVRCDVDIHLNLSVTVSSNSSVSVTPKVHCKNSENLNSNNETSPTKFNLKKTKHQTTSSGTRPTRPRCNSIWYHKFFHSLNFYITWF